MSRLVSISLMFLALSSLAPAQDQAPDLPWISLIPENDSRNEDEKEMDRFNSASLKQMNLQVEAFHHHLVRHEVEINKLLNFHVPFCELHFDAVHPLILTPKEKSILLEFFRRGGFILFEEDAYPYDEDEFSKVTSWPVIDFLTKELPQPDFHVEKINDSHPLFHQVYTTQTGESVLHELRDNPYSPNRTFVTYQGRACAFVYGRYNYIVDGKWVAQPRPFQHVFSMEYKGYQLTVNIYAYALTH